MKKPLIIAATLLIALASFWAGTWHSRGKLDQAGAGKSERRILYYVDPMNPAHTSDRPGLAPCGMPMEPIHADDDEPGAGSAARFLPPGSVRITPERQQMIGVRVERAEKSSHGHALRTLGRVSPDENRTYSLTAGDDGWVWRVHEGTTGSLVEKDQLLAAVYSYDFVARQQQYLYAVDVDERRRRQFRSSGDPRQRETPASSPEQHGAGQAGPQQADSLPTTIDMVPTTPGGMMSPSVGAVYSVRNQLEVAELELYKLGVTDVQLRELARTRQMTTELQIRSPASGIVLARNISTRQRFGRGEELYRIAELSRVWVLADVFEGEAAQIRPGDAARVLLPQRGRSFQAVAAAVPPVFDPVTRSFKVRFEVDNADLALRPDMFVDVEISLQFPPGVILSADAVVDTGRARIVFVDVGDGYFEPRMVETGRRLGGRVEILRGIMPGEQVVVSGNFLVDSESRMKLAAAGMHGAPVRDPVCGMPVHTGQARSAGLMSEHGGEPHYFCAPQCKKAFDEDVREQRP
ncbi:MAG: efflux RND transporter periplasmic adaptor subunit [Syntrophobacteraceae bacterium]|nr:efflux RND transporter periplasmic adaptor subunit [Syntrophobacteraceae bacterium]